MVTDRQTDRLTHMPHNDPAQYTVLGWVKTSSVKVHSFSLGHLKVLRKNNNKLSLGLNLNTKILDGIKKSWHLQISHEHSPQFYEHY